MSLGTILLIVVILMLVAGGHMMWQVRSLAVDDSAHCLKLFRANRETGALLAFALIFSTWIG